MTFGINTTCDISKLSQILLAKRLMKSCTTVQQFLNTPCRIYAKYHYNIAVINSTNKYEWSCSTAL